MQKLLTVTVVMCLFSGLPATSAKAQNKSGISQGLIGHWPLLEDSKDVSGNSRHAKVHHVVWGANPKLGNAEKGALFDGQRSFLEVEALPSSIILGRQEFSVATWVWSDGPADDLPGDIVSQYDPTTRKGFSLTLKTNTGVTFNQANYRQLQFGIDSNRISAWRDVGQPGKKSLLAFGLVTHRGRLFAGTCEPGKGDSGRVYVYENGTTWTDCGSPSPSNAVTSMATFNGELYVGTGKYRVAGSALAESENTNLGGRIYRYAGGTKWVDCGQLTLGGQSPDIEAVSGIVSYKGLQYAGSLYKPAGFFLNAGSGNWQSIGVPDGKRVEALAIYNGHLYASSYDSGHVYRFDGKEWSDLGQLGDAAENTQTYSFAVYEGRLCAGTWRSGRVYRYEGDTTWTDVGRLGEELEVMGMLVHNGRLIAGTLPLAEVYQYEGGDRWTKLEQLDTTPDVKYRRAWTMAEYQGQLYCSTLPSGHVHACEVGKQTTWDEEFPSGWHHIAAVKAAGKLQLYVDGELKSSSTEFNAADFDLTNNQPLRIGAGPNDYWHGLLRDVRLYNRALTAEEAKSLSKLK